MEQYMQRYEKESMESPRLGIFPKIYVAYIFHPIYMKQSPQRWKYGHTATDPPTSCSLLIILA